MNTVIARRFAYIAFLVQIGLQSVASQNLPQGFEDVTLLQNLLDPASMAFAPDGRLFYGERISGALRIAKLNTTTNAWEVEPVPFYTFDVPPTRHRSAGLRAFTFDPDFENNGYVYAFYMKNNPRHNRVVRIQASPNDPDIALSTETLLLNIPFNTNQSSGSHNGGDITFGSDGKLYFTTGDGWNGGDNVQSLSTFTGKLFRINKDGSIPTDNPFYNTAIGDYRAIYSLGFRNPYTMAVHPESGNIYVNDAVGSNKASVFQIRTNGGAGSNFGHDGYNGIGQDSDIWNNVFVEDAILVTGGAWYPRNGAWPQEYHGSYFTAMWGSNRGNAGSITRTPSETNLNTTTFASNVISPPRHKPVMLKIGPDQNLYYMLTDYETGDAEIHMIKYTGQATAAAATFDPPTGQYDDPIAVEILTTTPNATLYYTTDGSTPSNTSNRYEGVLQIEVSTVLKAITYAEGLNPSSVSSASYTIGMGNNIPPVASAGPDISAEANTFVTLNGSDSFDPDGDELEISESWEQLEGPTVVINDADETVANFTPTELGTYTFRITVTDIDGASDTDDVKVTVVARIDDVTGGVVARWSLEEGSGIQVEDTSGNSNTGIHSGALWSEDTPDDSTHSLLFSGPENRVDIGNFDVGSTAMSITFWTKITEFAIPDARFISKASGGSENEHFWMLSTFEGSKLRFRLKTLEGGTTTLITPENVLDLDQWVHIVATYDGSAMKLYLDGLLVAETPKSGTIATDPSVSAAIGNQPADIPGGERALHGFMDEIRIYDKALTLDEMDTIRNSNPIIDPEGGPVTDETQNVVLFPNPTDGNLQMLFETEQAGTSRVELFDALGKLVWKSPITVSSGSNTVDFDFNNLSSGVYYLRMAHRENSSVSTIIVR